MKTTFKIYTTIEASVTIDDQDEFFPEIWPGCEGVHEAIELHMQNMGDDPQAGMEFLNSEGDISQVSYRISSEE